MLDITLEIEDELELDGLIMTIQLPLTKEYPVAQVLQPAVGLIAPLLQLTQLPIPSRVTPLTHLF